MAKLGNIIVDAVTARKDVLAWLKSCDISDKKIEAYDKFVDLIVEYVSKGYLVINEDGSITQHLINPMGDVTKTIIYQTDYQVGTLSTNMSLNKEGTDIGNTVAMLATLSSLPAKVFLTMGRRDFTVADKLTVFFY